MYDDLGSDIIESFYQYLIGEINNGQYCYGLELEFCDRNDFDPRIVEFQYSDFGWWVNDVESPLAVVMPDGRVDRNGRDEVFVRGVALQLRDFVREKYDRPKLSSSEISQFMVPRQFLLNQDKRPGLLSEGQAFYKVGAAEKEECLRYMNHNYPYVIEYIKGLKNIAPVQGYSKFSVNGIYLPAIFIEDSLYGILPSLENFSGVSGVMEIVDMI